MRQAKTRALLAAVAALMITSAIEASPQDNERSYLPPQSSPSQDATKSGGTASKEIGRPAAHKVRARAHHRHGWGPYIAGPPDLLALPSMLFFPFF